jgi:hypothetical protein
MKPKEVHPKIEIDSKGNCSHPDIQVDPVAAMELFQNLYSWMVSGEGEHRFSICDYLAESGKIKFPCYFRDQVELQPEGCPFGIVNDLVKGRWSDCFTVECDGVRFEDILPSWDIADSKGEEFKLSDDFRFQTWAASMMNFLKGRMNV